MSKINSPKEAEFIFQKLPSDMGIHRNPRKGTLKAPERILEDFETSEDVLVDEVFVDEFDLEETHNRIEENTEDLAGYDLPIISLGGDHSVSFPVIKALKHENPDMELVWLDAHLDLKEKVDGNVSHDVVVRELLNHGFSEDEIVFVGVTEIDHDEREFLEKHDFDIYMADEVGKFMDNYSSKEKTYLSVDIDVLKEEDAPGTGYPDGQLSIERVEKVVEKVSPDHADIVEVAPPFDETSNTLKASKKILHSLVKK